jgi:hypothetical protein
MYLGLPQLLEQLDAELGIEKFRAELESSQVLVSLLTHLCMSSLQILAHPLSSGHAVPAVPASWY